MFSALREDFFWAKDQYLKAYQLNMMALLTFSSTATAASCIIWNFVFIIIKTK